MADFGLLIIITGLSLAAVNADEVEDIKSLNEVETLQVFGDLITIVAKNCTELGADDQDAFDGYLRSHVIRIKTPEEKHFDFELNDLIPADEVEGREKRRKGPLREILIPLLLAIKHKAMLLPIFLSLITIVALKGFWAGMSGLVISKVVGLKVLLDSLEKKDDDQEEDQHENNNQAENDEGHEENEEPIVIHLQHHGHRRISKRHEIPHPVTHYRPYSWNPLRRRRKIRKSKPGQHLFKPPKF